MAFHCVVGGSREARDAAGRQLLESRGSGAIRTASVSRWPFERDVVSTAAEDGTTAIWLPHLHLAFLTGQTPGTRLVLTQSTYQLQRWLDWLDARPDLTVIAHASRGALVRGAPEAFAGRGPWSRIDLIQLDTDDETDDDGADDGPDEDAQVEALRAAFRDSDPGRRLETCSRAAERSPGNPALHLAVASAHMELQELEGAQKALESALEMAPDWEAPWFEYGKLWLRADDLERAADRFAEAARLMPSFVAALTNLGAALAEIDQVDAAVAALQQALRYDPAGHPILNNLAVIFREQGRLDEAVEAGRTVIARAPDFVFGHYNLGHALFLQGRFEESRDAYAAGHEKDPQKNVVQACRLAVARAAAGDCDRAIVEIDSIAGGLPAEARSQILGEAEETVEALLSMPRQSGSAGLTRVLDVVRDRMKG